MKIERERESEDGEREGGREVVKNLRTSLALQETKIIEGVCLSVSWVGGWGRR